MGTPEKIRAFSMIELLVVVAVAVAIGGVTLLNLYPARNAANLKSTTQQMVALLRQAQSRSVSQVSGMSWGVHFDNTNPALPSYALFSATSTASAYGASAAAGTYRLPSGLCYADPPAGSSKDAIFSQISGMAATTSITLQLASACSGGAGTGAWSTTTKLPVSIAPPSGSVAYNGYVYVIGGSVGGNGQATATVYYAPIQGDGTLGNWLATAPLPATIANNSAVAWNGYLYSIGGTAGGNSPISAVYYSPINSNDGTLGNWLATAALPVAAANNSAVAWNGSIYSIGGTTGGNKTTNAVYHAPINSGNGMLGSWTLSANALPAAIANSSAVAWNGYLYSIAGTTGGPGGNTNAVNYAQINSGTGAPGAWLPTTALPAALTQQAAVAWNGYVYVLGGNTAGNGQTTRAVYYAPVSGAGALGSWSSTAALPSSISNNSAVVYKGHMYSIGGDVHGVGNSTSTIYNVFLGAGIMGGSAVSTINVTLAGSVSSN